MSAWFVGFACLVIGYRIDYIGAHADVTKECERLGGFYVGKTVYKCVKVEK